MDDERAEVDGLWAVYKTSGLDADRDRLVRHYSPPGKAGAGGGGGGRPDGERAGLAGLWAVYKTSGLDADRDRLILHYSPLVKYVAGRVAVGLPPNIEQADLVSYGLSGRTAGVRKCALN